MTSIPETGSNREFRFRVLLGAGLAVLLVPFLFLSSRQIALTDDAYYYLLPATNFWSLGFFSFDGITATNGFHPLWMVMMATCALPLHLMGAPEGLPRVVLALSVMLTIWGGLAWYGVLRKGGVPRALAALIVVVTVVACQDLFLSGLETVAVFWSIALLAGYLVAMIAEGTPVRPGWLALYSLLVLFSRLDCGLFLLLVYALLLPFAGPRRVVLAGILLTVLATPYLLMNVVGHGAATPISGRMKRHWGDRYELETVGRIYGASPAQIQHGPGKTRLYQIYHMYVPRDLAPGLRALSLNQIDLKGKQGGRVLWVLGVTLAALSLQFVRALKHGLSIPARFLIGLALALLAFYLISTLYYALSYDRVWPWYGALGVMLMAAGFAHLAGSLLQFRGGTCVQAILAVVIVLFWAQSNLNAVRKAVNIDPRSLRAIYLDMAAWLAHNTPKDTVAAGWAVGEIGWYAQRPVINLEGLVGDADLLEANRATDLLPFLARHNVQYVCNFWRPALAPRPEALLAPGPSVGAWKRDPVRYFWTLRLRPMMDCPQAFSVLHRHDAGDSQDTSGYVIGVDQDTVARFLKARAVWRAQVAACAMVVPAEDLAMIRGGKVEANIGRAEGYFVRGTELTYTLENLDAGNYAIYGRLLNFSAKAGSLELAYNTVAIPDAPQWRHIRLGSIAVTNEVPHEVRISDMSNGVYLDQLYLVPHAQRATFEALPADWWL